MRSVGWSTQPRAAIYVRVSTTGQEDGTSLGTQEAACRQHAAQRDYTVDEAHIYREVFTGTELWERPELTQLREAVRRGEVAVVIAYAIDRLSRDPVHLGVVLSEAEHAGADVEFVTEPLDDSPEGQLIRFVRGYAAKVEHMKITERSIRGRRARVEAGRPLAGPRPPYGYRWVDTAKSRLEEDSATSWVVRRIFAEAAKGSGQLRIAEGLIRDGVPTPSGKSSRWGQTTIRCILLNSFYTGRAAGYRVKVLKDPTKRSKHKRVVMPRSEDERIPLPAGTAPALVDVDTFTIVRERFRLNIERAQRARREPERTLLRGGYVKCGYCASTMFVHRGRSRISYRCIRRQRFKDCQGATIVVDPLDRATWARVESLLRKPGVIAQELERLEHEDPIEDDLAAVDRNIALVKAKRRNLIGHLGLLDLDSAEEVRKQLAETSERQKALQAERDAVFAQRDARRSARSRLADLEAWCGTVAAKLGELTYDQRRLALDALGGATTLSTSRSDACARTRGPGLSRLPTRSDARPGTRSAATRRGRPSAPNRPPALPAPPRASPGGGGCRAPHAPPLE